MFRFTTDDETPMKTSINLLASFRGQVHRVTVPAVGQGPILTEVRGEICFNNSEYFNELFSLFTFLVVKIFC